MQQIVFIVHVLAAICLVALVLLQQGKGANVGAAFGSGAFFSKSNSHTSNDFLYY
jgi:preprotein translocase subunit SecG